MNYLTEFDGKGIPVCCQSWQRSIDKLADEVDESAKEAEKAAPFVERVKTLLGDRGKVRLTHRLTDTPAIVTTDADEMSTRWRNCLPLRARPYRKRNISLNSTRTTCW